MLQYNHDNQGLFSLTPFVLHRTTVEDTMESHITCLLSLLEM